MQELGWPGNIVFPLADDEQRDLLDYEWYPADYDLWMFQAAWNPEEAAALILGVDPARVDRDVCESAIRTSPFCRRYMELVEFIEDACESGEIVVPLAPPQILAWLRDQTIATVVFAPGFQKAIDDMKALDETRKELELKNKEIAALRKLLDENGIDAPAEEDILKSSAAIIKRERTALLIIAGLAIKYFHLNAENLAQTDPKNSKATSELLKAVNKEGVAFGITMKRDAVLRALRDAAREWQERAVLPGRSGNK